MSPLWRQLSNRYYSWLQALSLVLVLKAAFPILLMFSSLMPSGEIADRIYLAFATEEPTKNDYWQNSWEK